MGRVELYMIGWFSVPKLLGCQRWVLQVLQLTESLWTHHIEQL